MKTYFKIMVFLSFISIISCNIKKDKQEKSNINKTEQKQAVEKIMINYKNAIEKLDTKNIEILFSKDAKVFESGSYEGTFTNYLNHHLEPELKHFESFKFSDYTIDSNIDLPYAFVTESYIYTIKIKENKEKDIKSMTIKKKGVATSILKKDSGNWKIIQTHTSSRNL
jgi:ketosteroid isomerase-like protein